MQTNTPACQSKRVHPLLHFEWWWIATLWPLPLLLRWTLPSASRHQQAALRVPFYEQLQNAGSGKRSGKTSSLRLVLALLMWCLLVLACMRPQWLGELTDIPLSGRDLMLGMDISGSMREQDFEVRGRSVERMEAAKIVASEFVAQRDGDRVGLILFGDNAQVQTPLTYDLDTVQHFIAESMVGLIGQSTAIGDAIGLAVKRLKERPAKSRVFVLLTDGANTAGAVTPLDAANVAKQYGIRIHTIGVGAEQVVVRDLFGTRVINPSKALDEETLKEISDVTGGKYFRARNTKEMVSIYDEINTLEPSEIDSLQQRPMSELYHWPLSLAFLMSGYLAVRRYRGLD